MAKSIKEIRRAFIEKNAQYVGYTRPGDTQFTGPAQFPNLENQGENDVNRIRQMLDMYPLIHATFDGKQIVINVPDRASLLQRIQDLVRLPDVKTPIRYTAYSAINPKER
jgi:hypothetical protein